MVAVCFKYGTIALLLPSTPPNALTREYLNLLFDLLLYGG